MWHSVREIAETFRQTAKCISRTLIYNEQKIIVLFQLIMRLVKVNDQKIQIDTNDH